MLRLTEQAVHQNEFACGPTDRLDVVLSNALYVVKQSKVRRVVRPHPSPESCFSQGNAKRTLEVH